MRQPWRASRDCLLQMQLRGVAMTSISRVLVVEDNVILLLDLIDSLADHGIEAIAATSADAAAVMLLSGRIDALVTDIELPGNLDGLQLARLCAELRPSLPIVVASAGVRPGRADLPTGAVFVAKPYGINAILNGLLAPAHSQAA